ncbi:MULTISPECIES: hypothetical protein [Dyella]|uniref:hypothetical protein n=1 Tax=Dyella TaxID=231454 RepID=UPI000C8538CF|nr:MULTISPECIES: hypothetical protein [Dyella]MDR3448055.1 hypothetical protein [Dyella sp.]PMQ05508.1 hypothetical protein DyAD56_09265 [Dyella sp. AD56]ULU24734.1 hypothetical protein DYST_01654 [Dyella terrae]
MEKLILLFYLLLSLTGCEPTRNVDTHEVVNGIDLIDSKIQITGELATFRCVRSDSGQCHYMVLPGSCGTRQVNCKSPITVFSMRQGDTLLLTRLPEDFASCVTTTQVNPNACARQLASAAPATP